MLNNIQELTWDEFTNSAKDIGKKILNPAGDKISELEDKADKLAKEAGLKNETIWDKTKKSFKHTSDEVVDFTKRNAPGVYDATKKVGDTVDDVGGHLGRNWAAYGAGAAAVAAGLGAYKLRQKVKERKQMQGMK